MSLSPKQISSALRRIAARIDASRRPSRSLVANSIRRVLAGTSEDDVAHAKAQDMLVEILHDEPQEAWCMAEGGERQVVFDVKFGEIGELSGADTGTQVDLECDFLYNKTKSAPGPVLQNMHASLHGTWAGDGSVQGTADVQPDNGFGADYVATHVNAIVMTALEKAYKMANEQVDAETRG